MKFYNKVKHYDTESLNLKSHKNVFFNIYFILGENTIIVSFFDLEKWTASGPKPPEG